MTKQEALAIAAIGGWPVEELFERAEAILAYVEDGVVGEAKPAETVTPPAKSRSGQRKPKEEAKPAEEQKPAAEEEDPFAMGGEEEAVTYTREQVRDALKGYAKDGKHTQAQAVEVLRKYAVSLDKLPEDKFADVIADLKK